MPNFPKEAAKKGEYGLSLNMFVQHFINALGLGSLYGLVAVGYTMVYGILRLIKTWQIGRASCRERV